MHHLIFVEGIVRKLCLFFEERKLLLSMLLLPVLFGVDILNALREVLQFSRSYIFWTNTV